VRPRNFPPVAFAAFLALALLSLPRLFAAPDSGPTWILEFPVKGTDPGPGYFVVLLSGDGGWTPIDQRLEAGLVARGIPVVGLNSRDWFAKRREPEEIARTLDAIIETRSAAWGRPRVLLVGYSFGADVLPAAANHLAPGSLERLMGIVLLAPAPYPAFQFHVTGWVGLGLEKDKPVLAELRALTGLRIFAVVDDTEKGPFAKDLAAAGVQVKFLPGGHHFGGDYKGLVTLIVETVRAWSTAP